MLQSKGLNCTCFEPCFICVGKDTITLKHGWNMLKKTYVTQNMLKGGFTCLTTSLTCHERFKCIRTCQKHVKKDLYMLWNMLVRSYMFWNIFNPCQGKILCFEIWYIEK